MYKVLYSYDGLENDTMAIRVGDKLTLLDQVDSHWWNVHDERGNVGLVPASYLTAERVSEQMVLSSTNNAIVNLQRSQHGKLSNEEQANLQLLLDHQRQQQQHYSHPKSPTLSPVPKTSSSDLPRQPSRAAPQCPLPGRIKRHAPSPPMQSRGCSSDASVETLKPLNSSTSCHHDLVKVPSSIGVDLVFAVREDTGMSFAKSQSAAISVVDALAKKLPELEGPLKEVLTFLCQDKVSETVAVGEHDKDYVALKGCLDGLTRHKDDSQQRGWSTHDDFDDIKDLLNNVMLIMSEASPAVSIQLLRENDYRYVDVLIEFYQLETRAKLRVQLLQVFGCFCDLGKEFVCHLLYSVLTTELAETVMNNRSDSNVLLHSILLLTMIFSTGNDVNHNHYEQLNETFVEAILQMIEVPPDWDESDQVPETGVALLLSFNQHFRDPASNVIMRVLGTTHTWKTFSEKMVLLFNREEDPVAILKHHSTSQPSVLKFLADLFASKATAQLFFTNDLFVLIEVVVRQVTDRTAGDELRTEYLSLLYSIVQNTNYGEHQHMRRQINTCLDSVLLHEEEAAEADIFIANQMRADFGAIFASDVAL